MMLRAIESILGNFIYARSLEELHAEAMAAKHLELDEPSRRVLNEFYAARKTELQGNGVFADGKDRTISTGG